MALSFPNSVRSFDAGRACVSFWGSDASLEITFQIEFDALRKLGPDAGADDGEARMLGTFDDNRDAILTLAAAAYQKHRSGYHRIAAADVTARR